MTPTIGFVLSLAIPLALVVTLFLRTGPEQPLRVGQLWITPVVAVGSILAALILQPHPPFPTAVLVVGGVAVAIGLCTGTWRADTVKMRIDPATGTLLSQTASYAALLFVALLGLRFAGALAGPTHQQWSIGLFDAALLFAMAMIVAQRVGIFRRVRALRRAASPAA